MPVRISADGVSDNQRRKLRAAQLESPDSPELAEHFKLLRRDPNMLRGIESLHPGWVELYHANRSAMKQYFLPRMLARLDDFFAYGGVDEGVGLLDPTAVKITFLLGAGASKPSGIPVTRELLPELFMRAQRSNRDEVLRVAEFCRKSQIDNIEDLLTAAQIATFCSRSPTILKLVD